MKRERTYIFGLYLLLSLIFFLDVLAKGGVLAVSDGLMYFYPLLSVTVEQYKNGVLPMWNSYMYSGFPLMASTQTAVFYPPYIIPSMFLPLPLAYNFDILLHFTLAGFFTYLYLRRITVEAFPSFIGGVVFSYTGYLMAHIGHLSVLHTAVWIPLLLYFLEDLRAGHPGKSAYLAAFVFALQIFAGHPQIIFYTYLMVALYMLFYTPKLEKNTGVRFIVRVAFSFLLGILMASPLIYALLELSSLSVRTGMSYDAFSAYAYKLKELPALLFPHLYRGTEGSAGFFPIIFAVAAFIIPGDKRPHVIFWGLIALFSLTLSLGDELGPLNRLMYQMPVYNKFRGVSKHLLEYFLAISILSSIGLSMALRSRFRPILKHLAVAAILTDLIIVKVAGPLAFIKASAIESYRSDLFESASKGGGRIIFFDGDGEITDTHAMLHDARMTDGYDPLILSDYDYLLDMNRGMGNRPKTWQKLLDSNTILSMLNTKYVVVPPLTVLTVDMGYGLVAENPHYDLYENSNVLAQAWSVSRLTAIDDIKEIKKGLYNKDFEPSETAILSSEDLTEIGDIQFNSGPIEVPYYSHSTTALKTDFNGRGFIVLSDVFYPGWRAEIDGKELKIYRTNGILRGIVVPEGRHDIVLRYQPYKIYAFMALSALSFAYLIAMLSRKKRNKPPK